MKEKQEMQLRSSTFKDERSFRQWENIANWSENIGGESKIINPFIFSWIHLP